MASSISLWPFFSWGSRERAFSISRFLISSIRPLNCVMVGTAFIIAHRISTIEKADKLILLDRGRISAIGPHRELLEKSGLYKTLYEKQFREDSTDDK